VGDPEDGNIEGFAIASEDRKFHPADVKYAEKNKAANGKGDPDRKQLILSSPMVEKPVHFRFAWGRNPLANLQATGNKDIPFPTQRSDNWLMEETPSGILPVGVKLPLSNGDENKIKAALREQDRLRRLKEAELIIKANGKLPIP
jgi:sialate O-acetylesterase